MKNLNPERTEAVRDITIVGDFVLLNATMLLVYYALRSIDPGALIPVPLTTFMVISNLCYIPCLGVFRVILHERIVRPEIMIGRVFGTVILHMFILLTVLSIMKVRVLPRTFVLYFYIALLVLITLWRLILRKIVIYMRGTGRNVRAVALVGGGDNIAELCQTMSEPTYGYRVDGIFFDGDIDIYPGSLEYKQEFARLMAWLPENPVHELYCGLPSVCQDDVLTLIRYCENNLIRFYSVPNVRNYVKRRMQLRVLGEVPVLSIRNEPLRHPINRFVKRAFDIIVSGVALVILFPTLFLVVSIIIKFTSRGPVFFKQLRTGEEGHEFMLYKFRSMKVNAECDEVQATKDDPRKTPFGNFLRRSNIDELPQLINVFIGDMSLVGPRPHMLKHTEEYSHLVEKYMMRHLVKPGITGWAQVTGFRGETQELWQMEGRVRRDLWYVENWTFLLDIRILFMTVINMFRGEKNAY